MSAHPSHIVRWHLGSATGCRDAIVTLPLKTVSEANSRSHWAAKAKRVSGQRSASKWACGPALAEYRVGLAKGYVPRVTVLLERIAPSSGLDDDNLRSSMKACRDGVADALEVNDRDPRVRWEYGQARGKPKEYAVRITVRSDAG
jgi:hypothetical protein